MTELHRTRLSGSVPTIRAEGTMIVFSSAGLNIVFKFFFLLMEEIDILKGRRKTTGLLFGGKEQTT